MNIFVVNYLTHIGNKGLVMAFATEELAEEQAQWFRENHWARKKWTWSVSRVLVRNEIYKDK